MPAKSQAQQATFGMALAVRRGTLSRSKASKAVLHIVDSKISNKSIKDYASTKHEDLPGKIGESLNEGKTTWHEYVKDGMYYVGKYGLGCDDSTEEFEKYKTNPNYESEDHTWEFDVPEGSTVNIKRVPNFDNELFDAISVEILTLGNGSIPFNTQKVRVGKTYYSTLDSAFGSGNIAFQEQVVEEGKIKKYQTKISSDQYAEIRDKPNKAKDWEWNPEEQLYIRKVIVLPIVTLKNDPSMDIHAGDYKVINKKEHNGGIAYELRSVSNPGLVITLPATYVDNKGIKKEGVEEAYEPYKGGAGPEKNQTEKNDLALTKLLTKANIPFTYEFDTPWLTSLVGKDTGVHWKSINIIKNNKKIHCSYDRYGFVIDELDVDQVDLKTAFTMIFKWYNKSTKKENINKETNKLISLLEKATNKKVVLNKKTAEEFTISAIYYFDKFEESGREEQAAEKKAEKFAINVHKVLNKLKLKENKDYSVDNDGDYDGYGVSFEVDISKYPNLQNIDTIKRLFDFKMFDGAYIEYKNNEVEIEK